MPKRRIALTLLFIHVIPIDVMRMSDFDNIESCHSPPSRRGDNSYYKCAVAEAHGHGPVAYVVRNEDLNELISKYDLEDASYQGSFRRIRRERRRTFSKTTHAEWVILRPFLA